MPDVQQEGYGCHIPQGTLYRANRENKPPLSQVDSIVKSHLLGCFSSRLSELTLCYTFCIARA